MRDMDFDTMPSVQVSWSATDQELYEHVLNITPQVDRPKSSKGRPRMPHLMKEFTEQGQAFKTSDNEETLWRLCADSHAKRQRLRSTRSAALTLTRLLPGFAPANRRP